MQNKNQKGGVNNINRNTSYYKSQVGKKSKKETSEFMDRAKKRQITNYRLAMLVLFVLMLVFAGLIFLGTWLNSLVVDTGDIDLEASTEDLFPVLKKPDDHNNIIGEENPFDLPEPAQSVDISSIFSTYNGVYLDVQKIESLDSLQYFIDNIKSKGINAVNIDIKKEDGTVPYHVNGQTDSVVGGIGQVTVPIEDIINLLHENELYVSGTIACFKDSLASTTFVNYALRESAAGSMRWEDSGGSFWLNAYSDGARDYIKGIVEDSAKLGFDEIILSWFFFPYVANEKSVIYEDETSGKTKYAVIKDFIADQRHALDNIAPKVKLGLQIPLTYFLGIPNEPMGLNPVDLMDWCNFFATSFAPAHVPQGARINNEIISNPESKPLETVKSLCAHFKFISDSFNFRPYLQAFNGYGEQQVSNQKQALSECDIAVWQLVNYDNNY